MGAGPSASGSSTRSESITTVTSSALFRYRRLRPGTVVPAAAITDPSDMRA